MIKSGIKIKHLRYTLKLLFDKLVLVKENCKL